MNNVSVSKSVQGVMCVHICLYALVLIVTRGLPCKHIHAVQTSLAAAKGSETVKCTKETLSTDFLQPYIYSNTAAHSNSFQDMRTTVLRKIHDLIEIVNFAIHTDTP